MFVSPYSEGLPPHRCAMVREQAGVWNSTRANILPSFVAGSAAACGRSCVDSAREVMTCAVRYASPPRHEPVFTVAQNVPALVTGTNPISQKLLTYTGPVLQCSAALQLTSSPYLGGLQAA